MNRIIMNRVLSIISLFLLTTCLYSQEISGSWTGNINIQGTNLRIVFNITNANTFYESTMDSPNQGAYGIPTTSTEYSEGKLYITAKALASLVVEFLKQRKDIDDTKIGLLGHSEGGLVASMVASNNKDISFVILMASPGIKGIEIVLDQNKFSMLQQRFEPDVIREVQIVNEEIFKSLINWNDSENEKIVLQQKLSDLWELFPTYIKANVEKDSYLNSQFNAMITPGYRSFLSSNPSLLIEDVDCPVLAINGKLDTQVAAEKNLNSISETLRNGGNKTFETKVYSNLNHLFQESATGLIDEYANIEQTISPEVLSDITTWLKKQIE